MKEKVKLDTQYIKCFVLGEWDLSKEELSIQLVQRYDDKQKVESKVIKKLKFPIHERSKNDAKSS